LANYRLVRYADDFVVLVAGDRTHAESLRAETAAVLSPIGLRLSERKTTITHIDEGLDFLGFRIRRHKKRGAAKRHIYTYPSRAALLAVKGKVRALTDGSTNQPLATLLRRLNPVLRGWANYFRHGASSKTFAYLDAFAWRRVWRWLCVKHPRRSRRELVRRYFQKWRPVEDEVTLYNPARVAIVRYRHRHTSIPTPWTTATAAGSDT
jgi:RNA-directed DNA polymerase